MLSCACVLWAATFAPYALWSTEMLLALTTCTLVVCVIVMQCHLWWLRFSWRTLAALRAAPIGTCSSWLLVAPACAADCRLLALR